MPTTATLEIALRRGSVQDFLRKLERTTGLRFRVRRARVTSRGARGLLECDGDGRMAGP